MLATCTELLAKADRTNRRRIRAVRRSKVRTAERRLAEGRYDRDDLFDTVLEAILQDVMRQ